MPKRLYAALLAVAAAVALVSCSSSADTSAPTAAAVSADQVVTTLASKIPTVKLVKTFTADDDPNHLLGRPNGYTSKTVFSDSRVPADQLTGLPADSADRGGSVEVFGDDAGAKARAAFIQGVAKGLPAAAEYDYQVGAVLVRVSRLLTPDQAKGFEAAAK